MDRFAPFRPGRAVILPLLLPAVLLPLCLPQGARAVGFIEQTAATNPFHFDNWTGAQSCPYPGESPGCYEDLLNSSFLLAGEPGITTTWTLLLSSNSTPYEIKFTLAFNDPLNVSGYGFYEQKQGTNLIAGGVEDYVLPGGSISRTIILQPGQSFSFGVNNGVGDDPQIMNVSGFDATPVPAPLPLLGAGAAFGFIRRRRALLRAAAQAQ